jgi:hypothetical protein
MSLAGTKAAPLWRVSRFTRRRLTQACPAPPGLLAERIRSGTSAAPVPSGARPLGEAAGRRSREKRKLYCVSENCVSSSKAM